MTRGRKPRPVMERLMERVVVDASGCWTWTGAQNGRGYGVIGVERQRMMLTHRVAYEHFMGPIPEGLVIDHLCRVPLCCNPEHLEAVTQRVNVHRGEGNATKQTCPQGHPYDYVGPDGRRKCKRCRAAAQRRYISRRR